jgi:hypothetical protein
MGFFSKILSTFKSIRLNDKNPVNGQELDFLLVGSMYAEQQSAYLNSYETGLNKPEITKLVETYWGIQNQNDALEVLQGLHYKNQDDNLNIVYKAIEGKENYVEILKSGLSNDKATFDYYLDFYRKINNVIPELIEQNLITDFSQLKKAKDSAWNYGRGVFLSRCCYELGYLSEKELKEYIAKSYAGIKNYCSTWQEYTNSYILGRAIWGGSNNSGMIQIANDLLNNEKSPLKNKKYL